MLKYYRSTGSESISIFVLFHTNWPFIMWRERESTCMFWSPENVGKGWAEYGECLVLHCMNFLRCMNFWSDLRWWLIIMFKACTSKKIKTGPQTLLKPSKVSLLATLWQLCWSSKKLFKIVSNFNLVNGSFQFGLIFKGAKSSRWVYSSLYFFYIEPALISADLSDDSEKKCRIYQGSRNTSRESSRYRSFKQIRCSARK